MKGKRISRRATAALIATGYYSIGHPAITQLVNFAAQNSGIDWRNYYSTWSDANGRRAYATDSRQITKAWAEFKTVLAQARADGVTDADIINAAPRSFSGRLSWEKDHWSYCTGQYFCTEFRRAAITLLQAAIRAVRQARPPHQAKVASIAELKELNTRNGGCWFDRATMRFFGTRIETGIIRERFFVTSDQPPHGPRQFTLRSFDDKGDIDTVGEFCQHSSKQDALASMPSD